MTETATEANSAGQSQRIDKWLWHARVVKSRTLAQKLVSSGKVRVNREKTTSANHAVRVGDVLTISLDRDVLVREILGIGHSRRPFSEARLLYRDLTPPQEGPRTGTGAKDAPSLPAMPAPAQRPGAQDRRALRKLAGKLF
ncbi:MAG: RNA-binding S4 domain-containing protein [Nitratireductor sp.]